MANTITAGNATNNGLIIDPDNTGALEIKTGSGAGTTAITVDTSQNVGIGTSSPGYTNAGRTVLQVNGSTDSLIGLAYGGTNAAYLFAQSTATTFWSEGSRNLQIGTASAGSILFLTNNTERARIDSSGVITSPLGGMQVISGTSVSASGTAVNFTGIPSWVKKITVMFNAVSGTGTSDFLIQLGTSAGYSTSNYRSASSRGAAMLFSTAGILATNGVAAAATSTGLITISLMGSDIWASSGNTYGSAAGAAYVCAGASTLSGTLDRLRITTVNGTDSFDAGNINILYE